MTEEQIVAHETAAGDAPRALSDDERRIVAWLRSKADWYDQELRESQRAGEHEKAEWFSRAWARACLYANQIEAGEHRVGDDSAAPNDPPPV